MIRLFSLKLKKDFERVFKNGSQVFSREFTARYLKNDKNFPRLAIIVSQKVAKKATERNLLRRRLKEIVRPLLVHFSNIDLILITRPGITDKKFAELKDLTEKFLKKTGVLQ